MLGQSGGAIGTTGSRYYLPLSLMWDFNEMVLLILKKILL